jgi:hypothetical protein
MKEYWYCLIGPVEGTQLPQGSDLPMRIAVQNTLFNMGYKYNNLTCHSGWGLSEENASDIVNFVSKLDTPNCEELGR